MSRRGASTVERETAIYKASCEAVESALESESSDELAATVKEALGTEQLVVVLGERQMRRQDDVPAVKAVVLCDSAARWKPTRSSPRSTLGGARDRLRAGADNPRWGGAGRDSRGEASGEESAGRV